MSNVTEIRSAFRHCLFDDEEMPEGAPLPEGAIIAEGPMHTFAFHPRRLAEIKPQVEIFISELLSDLKRDESRRGDELYLNLAVPGREEILCLGLALGLLRKGAKLGSGAAAELVRRAN